jgi:hypothetical protein
VLVESVRTPVGPRHKHICYLGSICELRETESVASPPFDVWDRADFWGTAQRALDKIGIDWADRERIEASLQAVVPRPSKSEARA